jgi:aspartyl-tRNA(Asn)/glutamyl-tRNA(Gln) amidotransferase subunit A
LIAYGSSVDQIGPITKTVTDTEVLFDVIKGYDHMDSTSVSDGTYTAPSVKQKLTIGVPRSFVERDGIDPEVLRVFNETLEKYKALGYTIKDIELPSLEYSLAVYYILMPAEASSNLSRYDGVKYGLHKAGKNLLEDYEKTRGEGFGTEVKRRILLGTYILSAGYYDAYYNKANAVRAIITRAFRDAFKEVDLIATPTAPTPAFKIGEKSDPLTMYLEDIFTTPINLSGVPAISLPTGSVDREGKTLPIGFQLIAPHGGEAVLFKAGKEFFGEQ